MDESYESGQPDDSGGHFSRDLFEQVTQIPTGYAPIGLPGQGLALTLAHYQRESKPRVTVIDPLS